MADVHRSLWLAGRVEALDYSNLGKVLRYCSSVKTGNTFRRADALIDYTRRRTNPVPRDEV